MLRFLEERSLRDVGAALGVDEGAARKRVSRALDRLAGFFRRRGFAVPAGAGAGALLASSATAIPAGLAASAANAGLATGGAVTVGRSLSNRMGEFLCLSCRCFMLSRFG